MKKVLVITYYWPPSGGAGVQRILKTCKYLREFGWEPIVYTAKDAAYPILDQSLEKDIVEGQIVLRGPIWEPYELYKRFTGQNKKERVYSGFVSGKKKPSFAQRMAVWVRGNLFIPDARKFWIKPSIKFLDNWLQTNKVDAILSSGPPHSVHLIARDIKRKHQIPWLADFRDPWTDIDFYDQLMLTKWADRKHHRQEQSVLKECDKLATVSWGCAKGLEELGKADVRLILNGFDHEDFEGISAELDEKFTINHIGFLNNDRNPPVLWEALGQLCQELPAFKNDLTLRFIGKTDPILTHDLEKNGLQEATELVSYLPHAEVLPTLLRSQVLLLLINNTPNVLSVVSGKVFEYLAARRPIFAIGPTQGDAARVLHETGAGTMCDFEDLAGMKKEIMRLYMAYKAGKLEIEAGSIDRFTRKYNAGLFGGILDEISG
ncbi:MAG: glycosyl transferase family 1 [Bacteroidota bacterium]